MEDAFQKARLRKGTVQRLLSCLLRDVGCEEEVERMLLVVKQTDLQGGCGVQGVSGEETVKWTRC